jgi:hypothetical protein
MWCHTGDICIWNKVEYLEKGASYQNSIKENLWGEISCHRHFNVTVFDEMLGTRRRDLPLLVSEKY